MPSVIGQNEILLNEKRYRIAGPVRKTLVSIAAPRFTIGDTQRGADPRASILTQNDFRGGIGWNRGLDPGSIDRAWWTDCQIRFKGHVRYECRRGRLTLANRRMVERVCTHPSVRRRLRRAWSPGLPVSRSRLLEAP